MTPADAIPSTRALLVALAEGGPPDEHISFHRLLGELGRRAFGMLILLNALKTEGGPGIGGIAWRGIVFILPAPIFFGLTVRGLGFVPAIFLTTLIAGLASFKMRLPWALALAVVVTIFSTLVFSYGLGLPFRRFGPWLTF